MFKAKPKNFNHPRHGQTGMLNFAVENLCEVRGLKDLVNKKPLVVLLSCLDRYYDHHYLFGDNIDWTNQKEGCYTREQVPKFWNTVDWLVENNHEIWTVMPQQPLLSESLVRYKGFNYIELSEFYGVYQDWFDTTYGVVDRMPRHLKYHYVCMNKRLSPGRLMMFYLLVKKELLPFGLASLRAHGAKGPYESSAKKAFDNASKFDWRSYEVCREAISLDNVYEPNILDQFVASGGYVSSSLLDIKDYYGQTGGWVINPDVYTQSFVSVICETYESLKCTHIFTEKLMRALWFGHPFFLLSGAGALQYLKKLGFKTFDQWWDESYDYEMRTFERCKMIVKQLENLCAKPLWHCEKLRKDMQSTLDHNRNRLKELRDTLPTTIDLIDSTLRTRMRG